MRQRVLFGLACLAAAACSSPDAGVGPAAARPPNVVLVLADDLGWGDLRAYHPESAIPTPNVDRLAAEGMRFTDAHASASVCTPSRYGILTGRYAWRTRLDGGVLRYFDPPLIEPGRLTLPALLRRRGYATAAVGKWHLGLDVPAAGGGVARMDGRELPSDPDFSGEIRGGPLDHGFDVYFGAQLARVRAFVRDRRFVGAPVAEPGGRRFAVPEWDESQKGPIQLAEALEILDRFHAQDSERPFFLYFAAQAPHRPYVPAARLAGKSVAGTSGVGRRGDLVVELDVMLGRLIEHVDRLGAARDTLIILTSDNGAEAPRDRRHNPSGGWRGHKGDVWEAGHRVPFIARWGDGTTSGSTIPPGSLSDRLIGLQDLMATLAELLDEPLPPDAGEDSESFLAALIPRPDAAPGRGHLVHHAASGRFAVRRGDWKLILPEEAQGGRRAAPARLYNLAEDPREARDVSERHPEMVAELTALLERDRRASPGAPAAPLE